MLLLFFAVCLLCSMMCLVTWGKLDFRKSDYWACALIGMVVVFFYFNTSLISSNIAFEDDYSVLKSYGEFVNGETPIDQVQSLFSQNNEHRIAVVRLIMLGIDCFFGSPLLSIQICIGNLSILGICYLFYSEFKRYKLRLIAFVPVPLLLFSLLYYENLNWGLVALQNSLFGFICLFSIYALSQTGKKWGFLAILFAISATFTSGSGLLLWGIGALFLTLHKRYKLLYVWLFIAVSVTVFYFFYDYVTYSKERISIWNFPVQNVLYFFLFQGGAFYAAFESLMLLHFKWTYVFLVFIGGVISLTALPYLLVLFESKEESERRRSYFLLGTMLFLFGTGAMLVYSRTTTEYFLVIDKILAPRYFFNSVLLIVTVYVGILRVSQVFNWSLNSIVISTLIIALLMNFGSYYMNLDKMLAHQKTLEVDRFYIEKYQGMLLSGGEKFGDKYFWNHPTAFLDLLKQVESNGDYTYKQGFSKSDLLNVRQKKQSNEWVIDWEIDNSTGFNQLPSPFITFLVSPKAAVSEEIAYLVLHSEQRDFVLPLVKKKNSISNLLSNFSYYSNEYSYKVRYLKFPKDTYQISLLTAEKNTTFLTDYVLNVP